MHCSRVVSCTALLLAVVHAVAAARSRSVTVEASVDGTAAALYPQNSFTTQYCGSCENIVEEAYAASANVTWAQIEELGDRLCKLLPKVLEQRACMALVHELVGIGETLEVSVQASYSPYMMCSLLSLCSTNCCLMPASPEQVHLAYPGDPTQLTFSWTTSEKTQDPMVQLGTSPAAFTKNVSASVSTYSKGGWKGFLYTATATGLTPSQHYFYRVGDPTMGWTVINFTTTTAPPISRDGSGSHTALVIGDMGASDVSDATIFRMQPWVLNGSADVLVHAGDISYANGYQPTWDDYMRKIESLVSRVPYMVAPGNHEVFYNFTSYKSRFPMPGARSKSNTNMFYSFDIANTHYIAYNFEKDLGFARDLQPGGVQYEWLENDLIAATANRAAVPWIVLFGHRPLYCSTYDTSETDVNCGLHAADYRSYVEPMLNKYRVDLVIQAHVHNYERTLPVVSEMPTSSTYESPKAPVYVVCGAAGQKEGLDSGFYDPPPSWSAARIARYGYSVLTTSGASALTWKFVGSDTGDVLDEITITK